MRPRHCLAEFHRSYSFPNWKLRNFFRFSKVLSSKKKLRRLSLFKLFESRPEAMNEVIVYIQSRWDWWIVICYNNVWKEINVLFCCGQHTWKIFYHTATTLVQLKAPDSPFCAALHQTVWPSVWPMLSKISPMANSTKVLAFLKAIRISSRDSWTTKNFSANVVTKVE